MERGLIDKIERGHSERGLIRYGLFDTVSAVLFLMVGVAAATLGLDCLGELCSAYRRAALRLEEEHWLLDNCRDPLFFSKMRAHPTVCNQVETNARIWAYWAALKEVTDTARAASQPYVLGGLAAGALLIPLLWLCAPRRRRREMPVYDRVGF
jgi:hypothetical protein